MRCRLATTRLTGQTCLSEQRFGGEIQVHPPTTESPGSQHVHSPLKRCLMI